jgi:HEAT repeat protein
MLLITLTLACRSKSPESALSEFYVFRGAEDQLMDPLILAGDKVVPVVIERVNDRDMPRRRYAIAFLGNGSYRQAIPVLEQILQDRTEKDYFRGDALESLYKIDMQVGTNYAQKYQTENDHLRRTATKILAGDSSMKQRRSYWDAWLGMHN